MPTNRELLIAQRKREKGLPSFLTTPPTKGFTTKVDRRPPKKTGIQTRGIEAPIEPADLGLATEGMKDIAAPIKKRFPGLEPEGKESFTDTFQGKPIPEDVGIPSNVTVLPKRITRPSPRGVSSFGLPTDRLPSFSELGGAIGQMFKFVGGITKKRQALGLIPGKVNIPTQAKGLSLTMKDRAGILQNQREAAFLAQDTDKIAEIDAELEKILNPEQAAEASDIDAILNE